MMFFVGHLFMVACEQERIKAKRGNGKTVKRKKGRQKNTGCSCSSFSPLLHFPFVPCSNSPFALFAVSLHELRGAILAVWTDLAGSLRASYSCPTMKLTAREICNATGGTLIRGRMDTV